MLVDLNLHSLLVSQDCSLYAVFCFNVFSDRFAADNQAQSY